MGNISIIAQAVSIVAACWAIISGIGAWKREYIGKRKIELAEETLATFFEIKDAITFIRNPWSRKDEGSTRKRSDHETEQDSELLDRGYIVYERYENKKEIFVKFNTLKYKFMAVFGVDSEQIFTETNQLLNTIFTSANMLTNHYWQRQGRENMQEDEFEKHLEEMKKHEGIFWDHYSDDDEIRKQLSKTQTELEKITKPCFEEKTKSYKTLEHVFSGNAEFKGLAKSIWGRLKHQAERVYKFARKG